MAIILLDDKIDFFATNSPIVRISSPSLFSSLVKIYIYWIYKKSVNSWQIYFKINDNQQVMLALKKRVLWTRIANPRKRNKTLKAISFSKEK